MKTVDLIREWIRQMGEDPKREGLTDSPERIAEAYEYLTSGYKMDVKRLLAGAIFEEKGASDEESRAALIKDSPNATFYSNKLKTVRFFFSNILPDVYGLTRAITSGDRSALDAIFDY